MRRITAFGLAAVAFASVGAAMPARALIVESLFELPVEVKDQKGQLVRHTIPVNVTRDTVKARAPFLIYNHGRAPTAAERTKPGRMRLGDNARYFASLGYAVFTPTRIGYLSAGGPDVEDSGGCSTKNYPPTFEAGAAQTVTLIEHVKTLSYIEPKGVVLGQSFGGTIAVAIAAKNVPGVVAAVNFAGGGGGRPATHPEQPCRPERLERMFGTYGATAKIPTLWLYSENDRYFGKELPHTWFKAFTDKGGKGKFVQLPAHGRDGHVSFTSNPTAWQPAFEAFLKAP